MQVARSAACFSPLADGRVLMAGGMSSSGAVGTVELYNLLGTFETASSMLEARAGSACVTLQDGRVLVAGGVNGGAALSTAEIFDPNTGTWTSAGTMAVARTGHQAVLTPWGSVLIAGGQTDDGASGLVELYLPSLNRFQVAGMLAVPRADYALAVLPQRRVMIAGGANGTATLNSAEIYDANTGRISAGGAMLQARRNFAAATLLDGSVLIAGGFDSSGEVLASTEIFDPAQGISEPGPDMAQARANHLAYTLPNNNAVLLMGGSGHDGILVSTELYTSSMYTRGTGTIANSGSMNFARASAASAALDPGRLMVAGGKDGTGYLASSEMYGFATIKTDKPDYVPGQTAAITGSGWKAGEQVQVRITAFPLDEHRVEFAAVATADGAGRVRLQGFRIDQSHLQSHFLLTATGSESRAQGVFAASASTQVNISAGFPNPPTAGFGTSVDLQGTVDDLSPLPSVATGTVTVAVDGLAVPNGTVTLAGGVFDIRFDNATQYLSGGTRSISIIYNGDPTHSASLPTVVGYTVGRVAPPFILTVTPNSGTVLIPGQAATVTARVNAVGGLPVQGQVQLCQGVTCPWSIANTQGQGAFKLLTVIGAGPSAVSSQSFVLPSGISAGAYTLDVFYLPAPSQQSDFPTGLAGSLPITINQPTSINVTAIPSTTPVPFGQPITYVATVTVTPSGTAAGPVQFFENASGSPVLIGTVSVGAGNHASLTLAGPLPLGAHSITATYSGDASTLPAGPSAAYNFAISGATTLTAIAVSPGSTAVWGQPVTVTATVAVQAPGAGTPATGTVQFFDGATLIGTAAVGVLGTANFGTSALSLGAHSLTAKYTGDPGGAYLASAASGPVGLTVNQAQTAVGTPVPTSGTPVFGAPLTFSATVTPVAPGAGVPTGTLTFFDGVTNLGTTAVNTSGAASIQYTPSPGGHSITAAYSGDIHFLTSSSNALSQTVNKASTGTALTASVNGSTVALTASVAVIQPGAGSPTGTVQFFNGATSLGTVALSGQLTATLSTSLSLASGNLTAVYSGDGNFTGSTSPGVSATSSPSPSGGVSSAIVSIVPSQNPGTVGQPITFTVTITSGGSGTASPTGTVQLFDGGTPLGTAPVVNGQAIFKLASLSGGSRAIRAVYSGDFNFSPAFAIYGLFVGRAAQSLSLTVNTTVTVPGQPVTFTAQLTGPAVTGIAAPSGEIQFFDGSTLIGTSTLLSGVATLTVTNLSAGVHQITATYTGDSNWAAATSTPVTVTVGAKSPTVTTLVLSTSASDLSQLTLTATVAPLPPATGIPTGTVQFIDTTTNAVLAAVVMSGGSATATVPLNTDPIVAVYSGDLHFLTSASTPMVQPSAVNAASFAPGFAADEIVTLFGSNFASAVSIATEPLPAALGGATVNVIDSGGANRSASLFSITPNQLSFLIPAGTATGAAAVLVTTSVGAAYTIQITVRELAPGVFAANATGQGIAAAQTVRVHGDGSQDLPLDVAIVGPSPNAFVGTPISLVPATDAIYLMLYATGMRHYSSGVTCAINGQILPVTYAGAQPTFAGLDQINVMLPQNLIGAGPVNVTITVDGQVSNTVTLLFQ
jgi:uncharacterized protein (TIGR03437 family)